MLSLTGPVKIIVPNDGLREQETISSEKSGQPKVEPKQSGLEKSREQIKSNPKRRFEPTGSNISIYLAKNTPDQRIIRHIPRRIESKRIKISTMTAVVELEGMVDYVKAFPLLQIIRPKDTYELSLIKGNQLKLLPVNQGARVICAKYKGITRGIIRSRSNSTFANSVTICLKLDISHLSDDFSVTAPVTKDISMKLSTRKIQMCGAKSRKMAMAAAQHIVDNLIVVEKILIWIDQHRDEAERTKDWVLNMADGGLYINSSGPKKWIDNNTKKLLTDDIPQVPSDINNPLATYLLGLTWDFSQYELFKKNLEWLLTVKHIIKQPLRPSKVITAMVNFNYPLGFKVRRVALCRLIEQHQPGCRARYNNQYDRHVTIYYPCVLEEKPNEIKYSTLIVYSTGHVTQSGPTPEVGIKVHDAFLELANHIRSQIDLSLLEKP